ncbi:hypothetical protein XA68_11464 [Ophiocordyceps unilateralis]|uniref:Uncharacterized protein n=1 Tax=Ophiocordyceps unilateralis TaxID=268505 RepID=A0A2A9PFE3_OPHUN|nr:hypothetical protein XA68_11464 [Ophiocordyceps unilateralis]
MRQQVGGRGRRAREARLGRKPRNGGRGRMRQGVEKHLDSKRALRPTSGWFPIIDVKTYVTVVIDQSKTAYKTAEEKGYIPAEIIQHQMEMLNEAYRPAGVVYRRHDPE